MGIRNYRSIIGIVAFSALALGGCNGSSDATQSAEETMDKAATVTQDVAATATDAAKDIASVVTSKAESAMGEMADKAKDLTAVVTENAEGTIGEMANKAKDMATAVVENPEGAIGEMANKAKDMATAVAGNPEGALDEMANKAKDIAAVVAEKAEGTMGEMADKAKDMTVAVAEKAEGAMGEMVEKAKDMTAAVSTTTVGEMADKAKDMTAAVAEKAEGTMGEMVDKAKDMTAAVATTTVGEMADKAKDVTSVVATEAEEATAVVAAKAKDMTAAASTAPAGIDLAMFVEGAFTEAPSIVDCTTSAGTATQCYKFVTAGAPAGREPGPYCPRTTTDGAEVGGKWFSKEGSGDLVDITGEFILNLSSYYDDDKWMLYDPETNKIRYTATKESCLGAAKPNVEEAYMQNCIECELSYLDDDFSRTFLIPVKPIRAAETGRVRTAGIALDGSELSGPAPVDAILGAYTIAAFDDCGGHVNTHQGYHYHSSTGCTDNAEKTEDGHAPLVGYASDGYPMYAMKDAEGKEAEGLDECRGQTDDVRGYHYHVASPSENMFIGCLRGESVQTGGRRGGGPRPDGPPPHDKPNAG